MIRVVSMILAIASCGACFAQTASPQISYQSHRGGLLEAPENTLAAVEGSWALPGAVPEVDLRTTRDGVIVCIHDATLERTASAGPPESQQPVAELTYEQLQQFDVGEKFNTAFKEARVPALDEIFIRMLGKPERQLYLDLKAVDVEKVVQRIDAFNLRAQIIFVHGTPAMCKILSELWPGARVMTWISAPPEVLKKRFEKMAEENFFGVRQLQFHLPTASAGPPITYALDDEYLSACLAVLKAKGIDFQVRLFDFDAESLRRLIDLGVHWYVTDAPSAFDKSIREALAR